MRLFDSLIITARAICRGVGLLFTAAVIIFPIMYARLFLSSLDDIHDNMFVSVSLTQFLMVSLLILASYFYEPLLPFLFV